VRWLTPIAAVTAACYQPGVPPGGPTDVTPPKVVRVRPDSNSRDVRTGGVSFDFNEVVSERPRGATSLADLFLVSPSDGTPRVSWRRSRVVVTIDGGFRRNTTYTVRMRPGVSDLSNNVDSVGRVIVFSTGAEIAHGVIAGRVFDWLAARPAPQAYVEALVLPDSTRYSATSDSLGAFRIDNMPAGSYLVRAIVDQNHNRLLDPRELFDSVTISLQDSVRREMLAILRDSLGPGIASVTVKDSLTLRVTLDRALDTAFTLTSSLFTLKTSDSTQLAIDTVFTARDVERHIADSIVTKHVQDSVQAAARRDSLRAADSARAGAAPPPPPTGRRPGVATAPPRAPSSDTTHRVAPRPAAPIPSTELVMQLERALPPGSSLRLHAADLRSITGATRSSDRVFNTPRPPPPKDTSSVRLDFTGRPRG
jgi:Bacterial Ig-like domain/Carboxypeptidase regulatory-like domain